MRVLSVSVTDAGRALAARLPFPHAHGDVSATVRRRWADVDAFVLFCATGIAVRVVGPLLADKRTDPAVVCVDDAGRFAVALCGAHERGGNDLARRVAAALGAQPVVTTASEAGATWAPPPLTVLAGVGAATAATPAEVAALLDAALAEAGLDRQAVLAVATIDRRAADPAVAGLGLPVVAYPAERLATVAVPSPSEAVRAAVGTPSVAEAAALLAAGPGARLLVAKRRAPTATVALAALFDPTPRGRPVATRGADRGWVAVVGLGPGDAAHRTAAAERAVRGAEVVIGYSAYVACAADLITPGTTVLASPIGEEVGRAKQALAEAAAGRRVAVVCSGDAGVYGMASLVCALAPEVAPDVEVEVVPGVTAALAAAAALGAPLGHDHAVISLSDLLTPWPVIATRLRAAAAADLVVALYNPRSARRTWQLEAARSILLEHRAPATPVGVVTDACRPGARTTLTTLGALDPAAVGMTSCVIVGSSATTVTGGRMVTPRGYLT